MTCRVRLLPLNVCHRSVCHMLYIGVIILTRSSMDFLQICFIFRQPILRLTQNATPKTRISDNSVVAWSGVGCTTSVTVCKHIYIKHRPTSRIVSNTCQDVFIVLFPNYNECINVLGWHRQIDKPSSTMVRPMTWICYTTLNMCLV